MVLEIKGYVVAMYEIRLVDGNLMCTSTLSSYAAFFKAHDEIKMSSFSLLPLAKTAVVVHFQLLMRLDRIIE